MYGLTVITPATQEPVSLAEVRAQAHIDVVTDDATLAGYIIAARQWIEHVTGRALAVQTFEMTLDAFPRWTIHVPRAPVASITSITYIDTAGAVETVSDYLLDASRHVPIITPAYGKSWPSSRGDAGNVKIRFVAGETQPPQPLRHAVTLLVSHWNENREAPPDNPAVDALISPYRLQFL